MTSTMFPVKAVGPGAPSGGVTVRSAWPWGRGHWGRKEAGATGPLRWWPDRPTTEAAIEPMTDSRPDPAALASVVAVLDRAASFEEPNEDIAGLTVLHHGLQCAWLLRGSDPDDVELQVAGLLHDIGHLLAPGDESGHGRVGAAFVRPVFGERVAAAVEGHVPAKRYLVTVDATYRGLLSEGSIRTLETQGGGMDPEEVRRFRQGPHFEAAIRLRRADEAAKDPLSTPPPLADWLPVLEALARVAASR